MQITVRLFPSAVAVLVMSAAIGLVGNRAAFGQESPAGSSPVPTDATAGPRVLPSPVLVDSATPRLSTAMIQAKQEVLGRPNFSREIPTPVAEEYACRIIEATLLYKNGPNGGWCWLVATDCGDQYQKGDCWYTESLSQNRNSSH